MNRPVVKTGVIGHPIAHSKSPIIHSYWIEKYGLSGSYEAFDIAPQALKKGVSALLDQGISGFNVTVPHKIAIMGLCDVLSPEALAIGAVNTISVQNGKLLGTNSDAFGFIENLNQNAPPDWSIKGKKALVLGAGGAALAVVYALIEAGALNVVVVNRTLDKAQDVCKKIGGNTDAASWDERDSLIKDADLIVNTTSLGMHGQPPLEIDLSPVSHALVSDIVYAPLMTDLLTQAQERGLPVVTGIGMLLHQARAGFALWHGIMPEVTPELETLVLS